DGGAVLGRDLGPSVLVRGVDGPFVDDPGGGVGEGHVHDVGVPGYPADVGHAPVDVGLRVDVEDEPMRLGDPGQIPTGGVHDALGLGRGARGVEKVQQVLGVHRLRFGGGRLASDDVVVPDVATVVPFNLAAGPL